MPIHTCRSTPFPHILLSPWVPTPRQDLFLKKDTFVHLRYLYRDFHYEISIYIRYLLKIHFKIKVYCTNTYFASQLLCPIVDFSTQKLSFF
jgi:hypothetical protein